jgi:hypothetical protein
VETRGRTPEETAALFDGEDDPKPLVQTSREAAVIAIRRLPMSYEDDHDFSHSGKIRGLESYELRRPQLVLERERVGHTKGNAVILSFDKQI